MKKGMAVVAVMRKLLIVAAHLIQTRGRTMMLAKSPDQQ